MNTGLNASSKKAHPLIGLLIGHVLRTLTNMPHFIKLITFHCSLMKVLWGRRQATQKAKVLREAQWETEKDTEALIGSLALKNQPGSNQWVSDVITGPHRHQNEMYTALVFSRCIFLLPTLSVATFGLLICSMKTSCSLGQWPPSLDRATFSPSVWNAWVIGKSADDCPRLQYRLAYHYELTAF
jgi:hypothetical protein